MASEVMEQRFVNVASSALIFSIVLHISVPFVFITLQILDEKGLLPFAKKRINTHEAYQNFIQVDVVALPDALINQKKEVDTSLPIVDKPETAKEESKAAGKEDDVLVQKTAEAEKAAAAAKAKAEQAAKEKALKAEQEQALKKLKEEAARESALKALAAKSGKAGRSKMAGNIKSQGTSSTGMMGTAKDLYNSRIMQAIKNHFTIYPWQRKRALEAKVKLELFPTGNVRSKKVIKKSSDPQFDSAVLQAITEAQPFPLPDDPSLIEGPIYIDFKPE